MKLGMTTSTGINKEIKRPLKITRLMKDIDLHPLTGIGKPEPLRHDLAGKWSGRISEEHRIIYQMDETPIYIFSCKDLY